jgi:signal transduction histidine kinase
LPHVFERFYRGEKSRKRNGASGMGLGLVIAKELVEAHSGKIGVESDINKGTTVWFSLPIRD